MQISADHTDTLNEAREGQIVALHGLQSVQTGDTLLSNQNYYPFTLEPIHIQSPVFPCHCLPLKSSYTSF